jgi:3-oxoacyl-[acyl-carrier protein] reductase
MSKNAVALVTGASRGIGSGIALELARAGFCIAINFAKNRDAALECQARCLEVSPNPSAKHEIFQADISQSKDRKKLLEEITSKYQKLNILVNNAGIAPSVRADILEATEESFDQLISTNVKGPYFLTQAVANYWIKNQTSTQGTPSPKIITISSISSYTASVNRGDYCVSKAALSMLTPLYAARLAEYGIQAFEIRPGVIATDMTGAVKEKYDKLIADGLTPIKRWGTPADIGRAVVAIAEESFPFSTGEVINVDGGFHLRRL